MKKIKQIMALLLVAVALIGTAYADLDKVSLTDHGNRYDLVQDGDLVPQLFVNHKLVPRDKWPRCKAVLERLNSMLDQKHPHRKSADLK